MTKLDKKFIEKARRFMDIQLAEGKYDEGSKYLKKNKSRLPIVIYWDYREMFDMRLNPDKNQIHPSRIL